MFRIWTRQIKFVRLGEQQERNRGGSSPEKKFFFFSGGFEMTYEWTSARMELDQFGAVVIESARQISQDFLFILLEGWPTAEICKPGRGSSQLGFSLGGFEMTLRPMNGYQPGWSWINLEQ
ncbi:hypothetical protein CEXT_346591 [Caerostris extrusa]|uniref:Uncharacterized protein n=1 Tax=Caerostris extrusa TaxID=172846 RepID=A0AAV4P0Y6_CAEEX|nr:hypothetical protein CEXT_346591 [Caerostris extrusa]